MHARQRRRSGTALGTALVLLTVRVCGWRLGVLKPTRNCFHRRGKRTDIKGKTCPYPTPYPLSWDHRGSIAIGSIMRGWARSASGHIADGLSWIEDGLREYRGSGWTLGQFV